MNKTLLVLGIFFGVAVIAFGIAPGIHNPEYRYMVYLKHGGMAAIACGIISASCFITYGLILIAELKYKKEI